MGIAVAKCALLTSTGRQFTAEGRDGGTHVRSLISSLSQAKHRVLSTPGESSHNSLGDRQRAHLRESCGLDATTRQPGL